MTKTEKKWSIKFIQSLCVVQVFYTVTSTKVFCMLSVKVS